MIKVCSLEFLNKDSFDVDIMSADGRVLFSAGSEITPELLLRLYFKEIFVQESVYAEQKSTDAIKRASKTKEEAMVGAVLKSDSKAIEEGSVGADGVELKSTTQDGISTYDGQVNEMNARTGASEASSANALSGGVDLKAGERDADSELVDLAPITRDKENIEDELYNGGATRAGLGKRSGPAGAVATSAIIGPRDPSDKAAADEVAAESKGLSETKEADGSVVETSAEVTDEAKTSSGASSALGGKNTGSGGANKSPEVPHVIPQAEPVIEEDPNPPLEFDEEQAQRVAELSVRLAALLSLDSRQQDEVKQAAYYHNVGRSMFRLLDLNESDFKKKQAVAGYNHILNTLKLNPKIAEAAMFYNKKYQSSELNLKTGRQSDFPYSHIVAVTNYYDTLVSEGLSKGATIMKMLQLGGNKFNVFILHKFINMVRK